MNRIWLHRCIAAVITGMLLSSVVLTSIAQSVSLQEETPSGAVSYDDSEEWSAESENSSDNESFGPTTEESTGDDSDEPSPESSSDASDWSEPNPEASASETATAEPSGSTEDSSIAPPGDNSSGETSFSEPVTQEPASLPPTGGGTEHRTITDPVFGIQLTGDLCEGRTLEISKLEDGMIKDALTKSCAKQKILGMYSIKLSPAQMIEGSVTLTIPVADEYNGQTAWYYSYIGGEVIRIQSAVRNGTIEVEVSRLGAFAVTVPQELDTVFVPIPETSANVVTILSVLVACISGTLLILLTMQDKKRARTNVEKGLSR